MIAAEALKQKLQENKTAEEARAEKARGQEYALQLVEHFQEAASGINAIAGAYLDVQKVGTCKDGDEYVIGVNFSDPEEKEQRTRHRKEGYDAYYVVSAKGIQKVSMVGFFDTEIDTNHDRLDYGNSYIHKRSEVMTYKEFMDDIATVAARSLDTSDTEQAVQNAAQIDKIVERSVKSAPKMG